MFLKHTIIFLLFFILALLQTSFLPYFSIMGSILNIVFILFFILIFFGENEEEFFIPITAGFFLDTFLTSYFGISIISLLAVYIFQKFITHFFKISRNDYFIFYFIVLFLINFILYNVVLYLFSIITHFKFDLGWNVIIGLIYNLTFACVGFYIYKKFIKKDDLKNQLKLL